MISPTKERSRSRGGGGLGKNSWLGIRFVPAGPRRGRSRFRMQRPAKGPLGEGNPLAADHGIAVLKNRGDYGERHLPRNRSHVVSPGVPVSDSAMGAGGQAAALGEPVIGED